MSLDTHVPKRLYSLQKWFGRAISSLPIQEADVYGLPTLDDDLAKEALVYMTAGPKLSADKRVAIYNQQYWFRLFSVMQDIFPFVVRLFGYEAFNELIAKPYLLKYPPSHWSLNELGKNLPKWITRFYKETDKELIYEAALIDEAYDRLFFAGHLPKIKKMKKQQKLFLQPTLALFTLSSNLFDLREKLLKNSVEYWEENPFPSIKWGKKKHYLLYRESGIIKYQKLEETPYLLLRSFEKGSTLENAITKLVDYIDPTDIEEKMKKWFYEWVKKGFVSFG